MTPIISQHIWRNFQLCAAQWRSSCVLSLAKAADSAPNAPGPARYFHRISAHLPAKKLDFKAIMKGLGDFEDLKKQLPMACSKENNLTIAVEGNIGSGKSTLLRHFEHLTYTEVLCEPLDKWRDLNGHNALSKLYEDSERWSFSFNMYAMLTRIQQHMKPHTCPVKLLERSLYSTRYCFVQSNYLDKTITPFEYTVLTQWFDYLTKSNRAPVDLIVYLRADPETCYERLKKRSRKEEAGVPISLLNSLHQLHDDWLINEKYPCPAPVLVLDANYDLEKMKETYDLRRDEILLGYS